MNPITYIKIGRRGKTFARYMATLKRITPDKKTSALTKKTVIVGPASSCATMLFSRNGRTKRRVQSSPATAPMPNQFTR